jgi:5'-3' exonuclease
MWALFDASWIAYKAMHTMGGLAHGGEPTAVIYGFLEQLRNTCADPRLNTNRAAIFFDSKQSYRREAYPPYKQKRRTDRTPEEWAALGVMQAQVQRLRQEILPDIGFPCFKQSGLESDDLIAQACQDLGPIQATIITADGDLYQCINRNIFWYDPQRKLHLDELRFYGLKGVMPCDWALVKAIAGCGTDNVAGIVGVGEKTAIDYVTKTINVKSKKYADIHAGQDIITRNLALVKLPYHLTNPIPAMDVVAQNFLPKYNADAFFKWAERLGFASYLHGGRRLQWAAFFAGRNEVAAASRQQAPLRRQHAPASGRP